MIQKIHVTVDVHCLEKIQDPVRYRIFVDHELVAERNFVWDHQSQYIQEQMTLNLRPGKHPVRIEEIGGKFSATNLQVDNIPTEAMYINVVNNAS